MQLTVGSSDTTASSVVDLLEQDMDLPSEWGVQSFVSHDKSASVLLQRHNFRIAVVRAESGSSHWTRLELLRLNPVRSKPSISCR